MSDTADPARTTDPSPDLRVLVTGGGGRTGKELVPLLAERGWSVTAPTSGELDLADAKAIATMVTDTEPEVIVNLAAWTDLERCERDEDGARAVNAEAVGALAGAADAAGAHLVHVSTDYVFDGEQTEPYVEDDPVNPLSAYARTKQEGEVRAGDRATIVRTSWLVGVAGRSIITAVLDQADDPDRQLRFVADQWGSPTSSVDLAAVLAELVEARPGGTFHAVNAGRASRYDIARLVLEVAGHSPDRVTPVDAVDMPSPDGVVRPRDTSLADTRLAAVGVETLRDWRDAFTDLTRAVLASR